MCKSAQIKFSDKKSLALIIEAGIEGKLEVIDTLIQEGANVNHVDEYGDTALCQAALNGHIEVVRKLLSYLNARYSKNRALHLATQAGHRDIMDLLILAQAELNPVPQES